MREAVRDPGVSGWGVNLQGEHVATEMPSWLHLAVHQAPTGKSLASAGSCCSQRLTTLEHGASEVPVGWIE